MCSEFLDSVLVIYKDLLAGKSPNTVVVPTSSPEEVSPSAAAVEKHSQQQHDGMETSLLAEGIHHLCESFKLR